MINMSETCIVCLGDLGENASQPSRPSAKSPPHDVQDPQLSTTSTPPFLPSEGNIVLIAHLLPCGHNLHNECLKPWVERANSCPICRQSFNQVDLAATVGGKSSAPLQLPHLTESQ